MVVLGVSIEDFIYFIEFFWEGYICFLEVNSWGRIGVDFVLIDKMWVYLFEFGFGYLFRYLVF